MYEVLLDRHKKIIKYLYNRSGWVKGSELAKALNVSSRTIRMDISSIKSLIGEDIIISSKVNGYKYNSEVNSKEIIGEDINLSPQDRQIKILKTLIVNKHGIDIYDLADELFISESTLLNDIQKIKKLIDDTMIYTLSVERHGSIVKIIGSEAARNTFFNRLILNETTTQFDMDDFNKYFSNFNIDLLKNIIIDILKKHGYSYRYFSLTNLILHSSLMLERAFTNNQIDFIEEILQNEDSEEYNIALEITNKLSEMFKVSISRQETAYLSHNFSNVIQFQIGEQKIRELDIESDELYVTIENIFKLIKSNYYLDFTCDKLMLMDITKHIKIAIYRIEKGVKLYNPFKNQLRVNYPFVFDISVFMAEKIYELTKAPFDENEIAFLAIHIGASLYRINNFDKDKIKVLIYIPQGITLLKLILAKIETIYGKEVQAIGITSRIDMDRIKHLIDGTELIISTVQEDINGQTPNTIISPFFNTIDEIAFRELINQYKSKIKEGIVNNNFRSFFKEELFIHDLEVNSREECINSLGEVLMQKGYINREYIMSTYDRELISSTSLNNGLALPHANSVDAFKTGIMVLMLPKSIQWGMNKVKVVMLLSIAREDKKKLNIIYDYIIKLGQDEKYIDKISNMSNFDEFVKYSCFILMENINR